MDQNKRPLTTALDQTEDVACARECTGLMPAMPVSPVGRENLSGLMAIHCPDCAKEQAPSSPSQPDADAHPSDEHTAPKKRSCCRRAKGSCQRRQDEDRNP